MIKQIIIAMMMMLLITSVSAIDDRPIEVSLDWAMGLIDQLTEAKVNLIISQANCGQTFEDNPIDLSGMFADGAKVELPVYWILNIINEITQVKVDLVISQVRRCHFTTSGHGGGSIIPVSIPIEPEEVCEPDYDFNADGLVNALDLSALSDLKVILVSGIQDMKFDCNCDGVVNPLDNAPCNEGLTQAITQNKVFS